MQVHINKLGRQDLSNQECVVLAHKENLFIVKFTSFLLRHLFRLEALTVDKVDLCEDRLELGTGFEWNILASNHV